MNVWNKAITQNNTKYFPSSSIVSVQTSIWKNNSLPRKLTGKSFNNIHLSIYYIIWLLQFSAGDAYWQICQCCKETLKELFSHPSSHSDIALNIASIYSLLFFQASYYPAIWFSVANKILENFILMLLML